MHKKGFTLVELLAVIAILAILVIIALPNVMGMFRNAKKNSFTTEIKEIYKTAQQQWMNDSMMNTNTLAYGRVNATNCNTTNTKSLDLSGRTELDYYIQVSKAGNIVKFYASDKTYQYVFEGSDANPLKIENLGNATANNNAGDNTPTQNAVYTVSEINVAKKLGLKVSCAGREAYVVPTSIN